MSIPVGPSNLGGPTGNFVLELQGVGKEFGEVEAVSEIDLQIEQGEFVTLLGPSGCGKSTLLRIVAGIERPTAGRVVIGGRVVTDSARNVLVPPERRGLGMVFQSYAVWPHMTVSKNVDYPLRYRGVPKNQRSRLVEEAVRAVRLDGLESRYPSELSGGQQQRVALARAIVSRPNLLLLDEPVSNLDAPLRAEMRRELKRLQVDLGLTALYVTHDQSEALAMSDRVLVMDAGRVLQEGTPQSVYQHPRTLTVARFLGMKNLLDGIVEGERRVHIGSKLLNVSFADPSLSEGTRVIVAIRPDGLHVGGSAASSGSLVGHIDLVLYLGSGYEQQITLDDGASLVVYSREPLGHRGATIALTLDPTAAIAFPVDLP